MSKLGSGLLSLCLCMPGVATAQALAPSRITEVTLYPGSATIERTASVAAGTRELQLGCLPASFDVETLRIDAGPGIRIGEVSTRSVPRKRAAGCAESATDKRIAELEDQIAALDAESGGNDLALGYLRGLGQTGNGAAATRGNEVAATAQVVGSTGQSVLLKQHQAARRKEALGLALAPLIADRDRLQQPDALVRIVTVRLAAGNAGELRLRYQISGPGWVPSYRAALDSRSGALHIERLAQIAQASGEDWRGVHLKLSTGQPRGAVAGPTPSAWQVGIAPPQNAPSDATMARRMAAPAPAPMAVAVTPRSAEPAFDVSVFQGVYATEFDVPGTVDLSSGEQRLTLALGNLDLTADVRVRSSPSVDANAYLVAQIARPEGVWPAGPLQLIRDGAYAGSTRWSPGSAERVTLPFGRDDLVLVQVEAEKTLGGTAGFVGSKAERQLARAFTVQNLHTTPIAVEVLEATPVSTDESVVVTQRLTPPPTSTSWQKRPGVAQWLTTLGPNQSSRFTADYTVTAPKDARLTGWR